MSAAQEIQGRERVVVELTRDAADAAAEACIRDALQAENRSPEKRLWKNAAKKLRAAASQPAPEHS